MLNRYHLIALTGGSYLLSSSRAFYRCVDRRLTLFLRLNQHAVAGPPARDPDPSQAQAAPQRADCGV